MERRTLNLGIVAHVDAGKTTLTERLLFAAGVTDVIGSVDEGTTQTDSLALEQRRGITIKAAVVSFSIGDVTVNLIDTPGHPDFIAEVDRVLGVLDGCVLVVSAVEGVQPQTWLLMRALQRLRVPTLIFVNKVDRIGANVDRVLEGVAARLTDGAIPMSSVSRIGTREVSVEPLLEADPTFGVRLAETLASRDDELLSAYVADPLRISVPRLRKELPHRPAEDSSTRSSADPRSPAWAPSNSWRASPSFSLHRRATPRGRPRRPSSRSTRTPTERRSRTVRMFSGTVRIREVLPFSSGAQDKVTGIRLFHEGSTQPRSKLLPGEIGQVRGLKRVKVGDEVGRSRSASPHHFAAPSLEAVVVPTLESDRSRLRIALGKLAEQDPLINVRLEQRGHDISVSLYGEVQKEVIQATLAEEYGIEVGFREVTPICVERPVGPGHAVEVLHGERNPWLATIGMLVEPGPPDSGIELRVPVDPRTLPLYLYKTAANFNDHLDEWVRSALREGLCGWPVTDCTLTLTEFAYSVPDGPPSRSGPLSSPADFRHLTPVVVTEALHRAKTVVCEPMVRVSIELPVGAGQRVMSALGQAGATIASSSVGDEFMVIEAVLAAQRVVALQRQLPQLTSGEGVLESSPSGYAPVVGAAPRRARTSVSPLRVSCISRVSDDGDSALSPESGCDRRASSSPAMRAIAAITSAGRSPRRSYSVAPVRSGTSTTKTCRADNSDWCTTAPRLVTNVE